MHIVFVSEGRDLMIVRGWRETLACVRTHRRMFPWERVALRGASFRDLRRLPWF